MQILLPPLFVCSGDGTGVVQPSMHENAAIKWTMIATLVFYYTVLHLFHGTGSSLVLRYRYWSTLHLTNNTGGIWWNSLEFSNTINRTIL